MNEKNRKNKILQHGSQKERISNVNKFAKWIKHNFHLSSSNIEQEQLSRYEHVESNERLSSGEVTPPSEILPSSGDEQL